MLKIGAGDGGHQRVPVQPRLGASLEIIEPELPLEQLVGLFAHPARLDDRCQPTQRCPGGQVAEIVFAFAAGTPFPDQPGLRLSRKMPVARTARPIGDLHSQGCVSASKRGSDAILVVMGLSDADDAGLEEVNLSSAIHLALHELELGDLPLRLAVRP